MQRASFELLGGAFLILSTIRKDMGWELMWKTCVAEEDVVGKDRSQEILEVLGGALFYEEDAP